MKGFKRNIHTAMIIAESMRRFQLILCVAVVNALVFQGMQPPFTDLNFVGEYHYQDFISFLKSENRCRFNPMNISSHLANDQSTSNDVCMGFMKTVKNMSAESQIGIFEVKYFAFDVQYNYELKLSSCEFRGNLQHVEMMLICRGKTVNGTRCDKNSACKRKGEVCQGNSMMDDQFCTPTRLLYQSCDGYSQCDRNSECRLLGSIKTCQCMDGYVDINWHCVKSELSLGEKCSYNDQCSVTNNASRCLYNETKNSRMCSCVKGYIASGFRCIADRKTLLQYKEKTDKSRIPLVTTYHPALKNLNSILRNNLSILYTNERMADLFKDPPMAAFKRPRNLKDMVVRARLDNPMPNGGDLRRRINNHHSTIKTKKVKEPVGEHFNTSGHKWEDMAVLVIDHNPHWTDAERKSKDRFWMHRLKSFRPDGMNKQMDFTKMNAS
ncbi:uncharacterized protein [Magallana gigas]|uniref:uncharacterized protein n=1 Tax=Magallana gigas TaxID=29159 RepID=UPI003341B6D3